MPQFGVNVTVIVLSFIPYNRNGLVLLMSGCEAVDRLRRMGSTVQHHFLYLRETSRKENITTSIKSPKLVLSNHITRLQGVSSLRYVGNHVTLNHPGPLTLVFLKVTA